jgi:DNA-binding MarR family transcriptional regulator
MRVDPELSSELRIAVMRLARRLRQQRTDESYTPSQLSALAALDRHGALTPGELAAHEHMQPPSMTRIVAALESAGLVARADHATDGRLVVLTPTAAGRALLAADRRRRDAWLTKRLAELTGDELAALRAAAPVIERLSRSDA